MKVIRAIAHRDLRAAFRSPRYYILIAFYLFAVGYLFSMLFLDDGTVALRQLAQDVAFLLMFLVPLITAGSLAGELKSGELNCLLAEPVSERDIVLGKALAAMLLASPLALGLFIPLIAIRCTADVALTPLLLTILGALLLTATCVAAGIFASSFSRHPAAAAVCAVGLLLIVAMAGIEAARAGEAMSFLTGTNSAGALNPFWLIDFLFRGVLDSRPLVLFPAVTVLFLFFAVTVLESRRWRWPGREGPRGSAGAYSRSFLVGCGLLARAIPALCLLLAIHTANMRLHFAKDFSGYLSLSPTFKQLLGRLPGKTVIYRVGRTMHDHPRDRLTDLLDEVARQSGGRIVCTFFDVRRHYGTLRAKGLLVRPVDGLVIETRDKVTSIDLDHLDVLSRQAERSMAKAFIRLLPGSDRPVVLFSKGHGESDTAALRAMLVTQGIDSDDVYLASCGKLPPTSSCLAVIGPTSAFNKAEISLVDSWLKAGGRLLLCLDPAFPRIAPPLLATLGINVSGQYIIDEQRHLAGGGPTSLIVMPVYKHPIGKMLGKQAVLMPSCMALDFRTRREDPLSHYLLKSAGTSAISSSPAGPPLLRGSFAIALSSEGPKEKSPWRALVAGCSEFLDNRILASYPTNAGLASSMFAWLFEQPPPPSIPRLPAAVPPVLSKRQARIMLYCVAVLPALFVLLSGIGAWFYYRGYFGTVAGE